MDVRDETMHTLRAADHAAAAESVFADPKAPVVPEVEAQLAIYELLLEVLERIPDRLKV